MDNNGNMFVVNRMVEGTIKPQKTYAKRIIVLVNILLYFTLHLYLTFEYFEKK